MQDTPDGRRIFVWRGSEDKKRLAETIAESCATELFSANKNLVWLNAGKLVPATLAVLREVFPRHIVSVRPVNRGECWDVEYFSFDFPPVADSEREPDQRILLGLVELLVGLVARAPSEPRQLTQQQMQEIRARRREGEPADMVARAYGIEVAQVQQLARSQ
jgi:hypothetical protein